jgi:hypothetical protein
MNQSLNVETLSTESVESGPHVEYAYMSIYSREVGWRGTHKTVLPDGAQFTVQCWEHQIGYANDLKRSSH